MAGLYAPLPTLHRGVLTRAALLTSRHTSPLVRLPHLTAAPLVPVRVAFRSRAQGLKTVQPHSRPGGKRSAVGPSHRGVEAATAVANNAHAGAAAITAPGPAVRNVAHRICVT